jgi:transposase
MEKITVPPSLSQITDLETALLILNKQADKLAAHEEIIRTQQESLKDRDREIHFKSCHIEALMLEISRLKRWKFGAKTESLSAVQRSLFDEDLATDIEAIEAKLEDLTQPPSEQNKTKRSPKRTSFPSSLPRIEHRYEPASCECEACGNALKRIGEEVSEQLDCKPIEFFVHRHIRGKYACSHCETLKVEPLPPQVIEKGQPAPGLLAQVLVSKFQDHMPLYRQSEQYTQRSGVEIPRNTLAGWVAKCGIALSPLVDRMHEHLMKQSVLHADETPVKVLKPGNGKTHQAYMWVYRSGEHQSPPIVIFNFAMGRGAKYPNAFLGEYQGALMVDEYVGYQPLFKDKARIELACLAHIRRKFFELHASHQSHIAKEALDQIAKLYVIENQSKEKSPDARKAYRQEYAIPILDELKTWLETKKKGVPASSSIAKAIDYALRRWATLLNYLEDGRYPIDNNPCENSLRPVALGRKNWLFIGTEDSGDRTAVIMSLIASCKANGHNPHAYLSDVLTRLPTHPYSRLDELLPHYWKPLSQN